MEDPRYPIGPFRFEGKADTRLREHRIAEIASAPGALRAAVAGLAPQQLDTRYRENGWVTSVTYGEGHSGSTTHRPGRSS